MTLAGTDGSSTPSATFDPCQHDVLWLCGVRDDQLVIRGRPAGEALCYVERDLFGFNGDFRFAIGDTEILRVKARRRWHPCTPYDVTDADGLRIGVISKLFGERQYHVADAQEHAELLVAMYEIDIFPVRQMARRVLAGGKWKIERLVFWLGERRLGSLESGEFSASEWRLDMTTGSEHPIDRRLALAVASLDALRPRDHGGGG